MAKRTLVARARGKVSESTSRTLPTREQFVAHRADDNSPDWLKWSSAKCERERERIPKLDEWLRDATRKINDAINEWEGGFRAVLPEYRGSRRNKATVYALLAERFNMDASTVEQLPAVYILGYFDALAESDEYRPAGWFPKAMRPRLKKAASPDRKTKRVRTRVVDGVVLYHVADARKWWPEDVPSTSA